MYDADYEKSILDWNARGKEAFGIGLMALGHLPLVGVAPYFTAAILYSCGNYLYRHKKSHLDVEWGRIHMTSHYDHHMGTNQDANWCVTRPWFDWILGTRERYAFTAKETSRRLRDLKKALSNGAQLALPRLEVPTLSPPPPSNESSLGAA
jgi:sterol desaturase/sphingolipid hydroxylase (fatty acid hydroxylase superfamily)